jgi:hypothetical protein
MQTNGRKKRLAFGGLSTAAHAVQKAWHDARLPVRIAGKLRAAIESCVPVGYEDETGFHYVASDFLKTSTREQSHVHSV